MGIEGLDNLKADFHKTVDEVAEALRSQVAKYKIVDAGRGAQDSFGVSSERLRAAINKLEDEGYSVFIVETRTKTNEKPWKVKLLAAPGVTQKEAWQSVNPKAKT